MSLCFYPFLCSIFSFFGNLFRPRRPNNQGGVPVISPQGYAGQLPDFHLYSHIFMFFPLTFSRNEIFVLSFMIQNSPFSFRVRPLITLDERPRNVAAASNNRFNKKHKNLPQVGFWFGFELVTNLNSQCLGRSLPSRLQRMVAWYVSHHSLFSSSSI